MQHILDEERLMCARLMNVDFAMEKVRIISASVHELPLGQEKKMCTSLAALCEARDVHATP